LYLKGVSIRPLENDPPLVVDPDRMEAFPSPFQSFEAISRRNPEISQVGGFMQIQKLSPRRSSKLLRELSDGPSDLVIVEISRQPVSEALDHNYRIIGKR
jgi:hypothetical protein